MSTPLPIYYSANRVRDLPEDGNRYETVFGELLVTSAPRVWHQEIMARLFERLRAYLQAEPMGHALISPGDISWSPDTLVQPDIIVVRLDQARTLDWARMRELRLVIEVLSPSTARADRFTKRRLYQERRVELYWIVDPDSRMVEVWAPDSWFPEIETERVSWGPDGARNRLDIELPYLFRPI